MIFVERDQDPVYQKLNSKKLGFTLIPDAMTTIIVLVFLWLHTHTAISKYTFFWSQLTAIASCAYEVSW